MAIIALTESDGYRAGQSDNPTVSGGRDRAPYGYRAGGSEQYNPFMRYGYRVYQGGKTEAGISDDPLILSSKQYAS